MTCIDVINTSREVRRVRALAQAAGRASTSADDADAVRSLELSLSVDSVSLMGTGLKW